MSSEHPRSIRVFVALPISHELEENLKAWCLPKLLLHPGLRWSLPEQWHFTLAFLGEISLSRVEAASQACQEAVKQVHAFSFSLGNLGVFQGRGAGQVIWVEAGRGRKEIMALQARVASALRGAEFMLEDREFKPHLTLGRARPGETIEADTLGKIPPALQVLEARAAEIFMMRSELYSEGPRYSVLERYSLR